MRVSKSKILTIFPPQIICAAPHKNKVVYNQIAKNDFISGNLLFLRCGFPLNRQTSPNNIRISQRSSDDITSQHKRTTRKSGYLAYHRRLLV